ncbi:MAG TPA: zinc ribbon domain-containing protein [Arsenophonus apicola]|uniref:zinc ribbon domain-containing protein n=1 Tax=Arsenophonus TaxID=637 RepID=UPI0015D83CA3|nr:MULTISPECIES: zinc ribbon domain-containing protein [Arsenophonus]UBX30305.1 zinc ribbon domain-containing protein [Arsenophonus apicola]
MEVIFYAIFLGLIPAMIANSKGRSFALWWIYGTLIFIIALVHSILIRKDNHVIEKRLASDGLVKCPFCAEMIKHEAIKCKHCASDLPKAQLHASNHPNDFDVTALTIRKKEGYLINDDEVKSLLNIYLKNHQKSVTLMLNLRMKLIPSEQHYLVRYMNHLIEGYNTGSQH